MAAVKDDETDGNIVRPCRAQAVSDCDLGHPSPSDWWGLVRAERSKRPAANAVVISRARA